MVATEAQNLSVYFLCLLWQIKEQSQSSYPLKKPVPKERALILSIILKSAKS
jgi:hypothetical protein